jgi:hypothetical protein
VYISGPYRAKTVYGVQQNIEAAREYALKYWKQGHAVICPHANTALMDGELPDASWLAGDIEMLKRCDCIVMMPTWSASEGASKEHQEAIKAGLEVIYER